MQNRMEKKEFYQKPTAEVISFQSSQLSLLINFSVQGSIEDIEDGGELTD